MDHLQTTRLAVAGVVIALSIVLLGLTGHGLAFKPDPVSTMTLSASGSSSTPYTIAYLPYYLQQGGYIIILVAGCGGIIDGLLVIFLALQRTPLTFKTQKYSFRAFDTAAALLGAIRIAIGIAALIFSFIQCYNSSTFVLGGAVAADGAQQYVQGHFTLETWSCQVRQYAMAEDEGTWKGFCGEGKAARWLLVPYIVQGVILTAQALLSRGRARIASSEELKDADVAELSYG